MKILALASSLILCLASTGCPMGGSAVNFNMAFGHGASSTGGAAGNPNADEGGSSAGGEAGTGTSGPTTPATTEGPAAPDPGNLAHDQQENFIANIDSLRLALDLENTLDQLAVASDTGETF